MAKITVIHDGELLIMDAKQYLHPAQDGEYRQYRRGLSHGFIIGALTAALPFIIIIVTR